MASTRVAFISDLHANLVALDAVLSDIDDAGVDEVVCLGDIVDLGPQPAEVLRRLRERGIRAVRGNHDPLDEHPPHPVLAAIEDWTRDQLDDADRRALVQLPAKLELDLDGLRVLCVHASPHADTDDVRDDTPRASLEAWCAGYDFDVWVCGHTHLQLLRRLDARLVVNVGSVGMPFLQPLSASGAPPRILPWCEYAIVSQVRGVASVDLRRVPLDVDRFAASLHAASFPDAEGWLSHWIR